MLQIVSAMRTGQRINEQDKKKEGDFVKSNNKGFSLIELIISVTILALFSTMIVFGIGYMNLANSQKCVSKIDSGLMTLKSRNMADSKRTYLHIYRYTDGNYYLAYSEADDYADASHFTPDGSGEQIANRNLTISYNGAEIGVNDCVHIGINKKDGSFDEEPHHETMSTITVAGTSTRTLKLVTATGKYFKE